MVRVETGVELGSGLVAYFLGDMFSLGMGL